MTEHARPAAKKKVPWWAVVLIVVVVVALVLFVALRALASSLIPHEVTSVRDYPETAEKWDPQEQVLPRQVPAAATSVRFSSMEPFLQGGGWAQISYVLPQADFDAAEADIESKAKGAYWSTDSDETIEAVRWQVCGKEDTDDHHSMGAGLFWHFGTTYAWPEGYRIFLYDDTCTSNHWTSYGAAVNEQTHEVVYAIESW